jgi:hypothetical protein
MKNYVNIFNKIQLFGEKQNAEGRYLEVFSSIFTTVHHLCTYVNKKGIFLIVVFVPVAMGKPNCSCGNGASPIVGFPIVEYLYYQQWSLLHCFTEEINVILFFGSACCCILTGCSNLLGITSLCTQ